MWCPAREDQHMHKNNQPKQTKKTKQTNKKTQQLIPYSITYINTGNIPQ